jgi:hypothetical protein
MLEVIIIWGLEARNIEKLPPAINQFVLACDSGKTPNA